MVSTGLHSPVTSWCYVGDVSERQLKLDMDVTLRRANDSRRWILKLNSDKWLYRRILAGHETAGDVDEYHAAKAKRLEWEAEIGSARVEGWR